MGAEFEDWLVEPAIDGIAWLGVSGEDPSGAVGMEMEEMGGEVGRGGGEDLGMGLGDWGQGVREGRGTLPHADETQQWKGGPGRGGVGVEVRLRPDDDDDDPGEPRHVVPHQLRRLVPLKDGPGGPVAGAGLADDGSKAPDIMAKLFGGTAPLPRAVHHCPMCNG